MAKSKLLTPGELRSAKAVLKQELAVHTATAKAAAKAIKEAEKAHLAYTKAADKLLSDATKAHVAAVKASAKTFNSTYKEQLKISDVAAATKTKLTAKLQALEGTPVPQAPVPAPIAAQPAKRGRPRKEIVQA